MSDPGTCPRCVKGWTCGNCTHGPTSSAGWCALPDAKPRHVGSLEAACAAFAERASPPPPAPPDAGDTLTWIERNEPGGIALVARALAACPLPRARPLAPDLAGIEGRVAEKVAHHGQDSETGLLLRDLLSAIRALHERLAVAETVIAGTAYPSDATLTREQALHGWFVANRQRDRESERAESAERALGEARGVLRPFVAFRATWQAEEEGDDYPVAEVGRSGEVFRITMGDLRRARALAASSPGTAGAFVPCGSCAACLGHLPGRACVFPVPASSSPGSATPHAHNCASVIGGKSACDCPGGAPESPGSADDGTEGRR
jgi:hypothetical protein